MYTGPGVRSGFAMGLTECELRSHVGQAMALLLRDLVIHSHACELYIICCILLVLNELSTLYKLRAHKSWVCLCHTSIGLTLTLTLPLPRILQSCFIQKVCQMVVTSEA